MELMVNSDQLVSASGKIKKLAGIVESSAVKVRNITSRIEMTLPAEATLNKAVEKAIEEMRVLQSNFISMSKVLSSCAEVYSKCQSGLLNDIQTLETSVNAGSGSSSHDMSANVPAPETTKGFDTTGAYGGNQRAPYDNYKDYADIVRKYYPDMTDTEVEDYLKKLNSEGCGYVAMINTVFINYEGRPDEFKKAFGFDMYDKNGEPNYNELLVDFYCDQDNHNKKSFLFLSWDSVDDKEDWLWKDTDKDGKDDTYAEYGFGTTEEQMEYRWEQYCEDNGVDVNVKKGINVTPSNFEELSKDGMISIRCSNYTMYDTSGSAVKVGGGHAMLITGVTSDGKYIVSSWGNKYTLDPADIDIKNDGWVDYQQIVY